MDSYLYTLIAFSSTDVIGFYRFKKIKQSFANIHDFLDCPVADQMELLGLKTEKAQKILLNMKKQADLIIDQCTQKNISFISHDNPSYPKLLKNIADPPYLLYSQGQYHAQIPLIAVIGTRNTTSDAEKINRAFCEAFVYNGLGVVSGLAKGHDAIASETVLKKEGYTVAVLGTAIDVVYPAYSTELYQQVREKGAILSEYPPGMVSTKWRFPRRNRIVSGMAQAVCVMQAPEKSGTMITVSMASEHGKDVYVVPGNPLIPQYRGSNTLIQKGAKIALSPEYVIQEITQSYPNIETIQYIAQTKADIPKELVISDLSSDESQIIALTEEHIHIDDILREVEMSISSLTSLLTIMELKGLIVQKPGQLYIKADQ